eukprot:gene36073-44489_t
MLGCGITHAHAHAETPAETALPTVVVTANGGGGTAEDGYRARQSGIAGFSDQDLLDTPLSVKVLPAQLLANLKIDTIAGIDRLDASVGSSAANPGWFSSPTIRGFTLDNSSNFRYNGMTMINQQATALENKERVEILKGPSALQAGFSAPGGIIHYVTKRPGLADTTQLHLSASQYGNYKAHADVSRRSADGRYGLRLNAAVEDERSYVHGVDGKRSFLSLAADVRIAPGTQLNTFFSWLASSAISPASRWMATAATAIAPPLARQDRPSVQIDCQLTATRAPPSASSTPTPTGRWNPCLSDKRPAHSDNNMGATANRLRRTPTVHSP